LRVPQILVEQLCDCIAEHLHCKFKTKVGKTAYNHRTRDSWNITGGPQKNFNFMMKNAAIVQCFLLVRD